MATQLGVVNEVLNELGQLAVSNVNNDPTAQLIDQKINLVYLRLLTFANWTFATAYTALNLTALPGLPELPYAYQLPFDFQKLVQVENQNNYAIQGNILYSSDAVGVNIYYISNDTSFDLWPSEFEYLVVLQTAAEAALVVTQNQPLTQYLEERAKQQLDDAINDNANNAGFFNNQVKNSYDRHGEVL